jgi:outer membrane protein assembly factor BamB
LVVSLRPDNLASEWTLQVDAPVLASPGALGDTLFVVTRTGTLYRIDPAPHPVLKPIASLAWPVTSPVTIAGGRILLGGADGIIRALHTDGKEVWRVQVWRPVEVGPLPLSDGLVAVGGNGDLHRFRQ